MTEPAIFRPPVELICHILEFVQVVQLPPFAITSRNAQKACNIHLQTRLRWLVEAADTGTNVYLRAYLQKFCQTVDTETRTAIKSALPFVSCPDDFRNNDKRIQEFYQRTALAVTAARSARASTSYLFGQAEDAARKAGMPLPDSAAIQRIYSEAATRSLAMLLNKVQELCGVEEQHPFEKNEERWSRGRQKQGILIDVVPPRSS